MRSRFKRHSGGFNKLAVEQTQGTLPGKGRSRKAKVLILLAVLIGGYFFLQDQVVDLKLRPLIQRELAKAVHSEVSIRSVRASLLGRVVLNHVSFILPGDPWETRLSVEKVEIGLDLYDLIIRRKPLENCLASLSLVRPNILLAHKEQPPRPYGPPAPGEVPVVSAGKPLPPLLPVRKVFVKNGSFSMQAGLTPREMLTGLHFNAFEGKDGAWGLELNAHAPETKGRGNLKFNGSLRLGEWKASGKLTLDQWPLASGSLTLKELAGWTLEAGNISLESPIVFEPGKGLWFDAWADFSQAAVRSPAPASILLSQITGRALLRPSEIKVSNGIAFQLGRTIFKATGTLPLDGRPLAVKASTDQLRLESIFEEILKLTNLKVEGLGTAALSVSGSFSDPVVEGTAKLGSSKVGNWSLDSLSVEAGYRQRSIILGKVDGKLYDGQLKADGFLSLTGNMDSPVSLTASLTDIEASKLPNLPGLGGLKGKSDAEVRWSGSLAHPIISANARMALARTIRNSVYRYSVSNSVLMKDGTIEITSLINDKAKLEGFLTEGEGGWGIKTFTFSTGKKAGRLTATGTWPKETNKPIDIKLVATNLDLKELPFLNDQFSDISGKVDLDARLGGTRENPEATVRVSSPSIVFCAEIPQPVEVFLTWKPGELEFKKLEIGGMLAASGKLGLSSDSSLNMDMKAKRMPIGCIAEILAWNNPPQPFEGWITGSLHLSGVKKSPILSGNEEIVVQALKVGDWHADKVEALLNLDHGKLLVRKLKLLQGANSLSATGSWDIQSEPGVMALRFAARDFQLGMGPTLKGDFVWNAQTKGSLKNWTGTLASALFSLRDLKGSSYKFSDFSSRASCENLVYKGSVSLGKFISGSATFDASRSSSTVRALLKIEPALLSAIPELSQFLPESLKASGRVSGTLDLKEGTFETLPMSGFFAVTDGSIGNYKFNQAGFEFSGEKKKVSAVVSLAREETKYSLSGTLESGKVFWDPQSKVLFHGSVEKEKLSNLLAVLGVSAQQHKVAGRVEGNLDVSGNLSLPLFGFSMTGENLRYDDNLVTSAKLQFSYSEGKLLLEKNRITLPKGQINIEKGTASVAPGDSSIYLVDLSGSAEDVPIALFNLTSEIKLNGRFALEDKPDRPTFEGRISVLEPDRDPKNPSPFEIGLSIKHKVVEFKRLDSKQPQLVGLLDLSKEGKVSFQDLHLENSSGSFSVDGTLDMAGNSHLVSDAKDVPIEKVGRWLVPNFPLKGTGNYHLIFEGNPDNPLVTVSVSISNGKMKDLDFDLLSGMLKSKDNTLYLGSPEAPLVLSRKGLFTFNLSGKAPLSFTKAGGLKIKDREMDIRANMTQGDFGLILLAGLAKQASGSMDFSARVTGTLDNPVLTLDLDLKQCQMVPPLGLIAKSIDDINGRIKVRNNVLAVEDLNAQIGPGRVFISTPPIAESKIVLVNFIPTFLDFRVRTVGERGVLLSISGIMRQKPKEWGEIHFYGASREEPLLIRGPLEEPRVIGTALLDTGRYTFPPVIETDEKGGKIEYRELARVIFDLKLASGKSTWYSNDVSTQYLEVKVDPGQEILLSGRDSDRTPLEAGIKCSGSASSHEGWLRYLGREFKVEQASLYMPKGKPPAMQGRARDRLQNADVVSAGGIRQTDVDIWVDFKGTFGSIDFTLNSNPRFSTDEEKHQKMLLSYIVFGKDMTGLSREEVTAAYEQNVGGVLTDAFKETVARIASNEATKLFRPIFQNMGNLDVNIKADPFKVISSDSNGVSQRLPDAAGNTPAGQSVPLVELEVRKYLDPRLSVTGTLGLNRDLGTDKTGLQGKLGLGYDINRDLSLGAEAGRRDDNQFESKVHVNYHIALPNIIGPKKGDVEPPKFERFDVLSTGLGKFEVLWTTDEATKSEVWVLSAEGEKVKYFPEKGQPDYKHTLVVDNLDPNKRYKIRISVKDPNGNETIRTEKASSGE